MALDRNSPAVRRLIIWVGIGVLAIAGTFAVDAFFVKGQPTWLLLTSLLLLIIVFSAFAARKAHKDAKSSGALSK